MKRTMFCSMRWSEGDCEPAGIPVGSSLEHEWMCCIAVARKRESRRSSKNRMNVMKSVSLRRRLDAREYSSSFIQRLVACVCQMPLPISITS